MTDFLRSFLVQGYRHHPGVPEREHQPDNDLALVHPDDVAFMRDVKPQRLAVCPSGRRYSWHRAQGQWVLAE